MSKIFNLFFLILLLFCSFSYSKASNNLKIYSREEWWANENYRYINSNYWKNILEKRNINKIKYNKKWETYSEKFKNEIILKNKIKLDKKILQNNYLSRNYSDDVRLLSYEKFDWKNKLAWPIWKTNYIKNIVIHHTESDYKNSFEWIKQIYKYHSLNREWWDIGYNYIIWYDWEIFEWRAGWDYVVWAHDTLNNRSTIWISIMWNYDERSLEESQYKSIKNLVSYLTKIYWIDLNKKIPYHKECFWEKCIDWVDTKYYFPIVWHQDWKSTSCPWENIYNNIIPKLIKEIQPETLWYTRILNNKITKEKKEYLEKINKYSWKKIKLNFDKISEKKKKKILKDLENKLEYKFYDWKKEILYRKFLNELKK